MTDPNLNPARYNLTYVWLICLVAAMGGLLFGYDWVVVGGAKTFYEPYFGLDTPSLQGWGTSSALVGCLVGAMVSGMLSDRFGRKRLLLSAGFLFTLSAVGTGLAWDFTSYTVFRIIGGVGIGLASNLSPMYIAEISPARLRGRFVSVNQLTIVIGVLLAMTVNWLISLHDRGLPDNATTGMILESWNGQYGWRWMFGAEAVPALAFFLLMFLVPESPRWLMKNGRDKEAEEVLARVGGEAYALAEVSDIRTTLAAQEIAHVNFRDLLEPRLVKIILIGVALAVFQQWCGINVIYYYAADIFKAAGYDVKATMLNIVITGLVSLIFTFVAIGTVDRIGRRALMLIGAAGLAGTYGLIGLAFHLEKTGVLVVVLTVTAIAFYSFSLAPVVWVLLSEIFPNRIRGAAMSIAVFSLWVGCFTLSYSFPGLNKGLGPAVTFWLYGLICVAGFLFVLTMVPETKGKSLETIERELL
ncbi:MAG: sugar porter family MFS transporter [Verrucomicrobiales bacterium]|nr:sugar porter family MFS transporter [Verrucomicrobiales bacterium]